MTRVEAIYLSKRFLREQIFKKYPKIAQLIMEGSKSRYMQNIRSVLTKQRLTHVKEINAQSRYKTFSILEKNSNQEKNGDKSNMFTQRKKRMNFNNDLRTPMGSILSVPQSHSNQNPRGGTEVTVNATTKLE